MNFIELDKLLREMDEEEIQIKNLQETTSNELLESRIQQNYSFDKNSGHWTINSNKLMKENENFAIHKHKRFVSFKNHKHDYIELIYVYSGKITQRINEDMVTIKEGQVCLLDLKVEHSIEAASEGDIVINIIIKQEFFDSIFMSFLSDNDIISDFIIKALYSKKESKEYMIFSSDDNEFVQIVMKRLLCEYYDKRVGYDTAIHAYILLLFTELLRDYKENMGKLSVKNLNNTIITEVKKYLCKNFNEVTLKSTAEFFHFNSDYLSKLIKSNTGESFTGLLQEIRLKEACLLLEQSNLPIDDIVTKVGYSNLSFFYKLFKKKYKVTPIEYRNSKNNIIN
jgi:AraC-like DNA-binding protein/mannose-6-phosphate isomerase-like protein (cupin superfamily)